jgi:hypothetical protein
MPNVYSIQTIKDTTEHAVIKLTAQFDGSGKKVIILELLLITLMAALDARQCSFIFSIKYK